MSSSFPSSWQKRRLSDVAELQLGKMLDKAKNVAGQPMPYLRNVNVRWGEIETSDLYSMRFTEAEAARFSIRDGDLLVCEGGEPGRCAIWKGGTTSLKFQKAIHRIRPSPDVLPEWVALFLRRETLEDRLRDHFTGTTIKHLPAQALAALELPLPPLAEQRRIVARIEALFARTRRARTDLERIAPLASRYREQRRKRAFDEDASWELTGDTPRLPAYAPPARFDELGSIPEGWQWAEIATISEVGGGLTKNQTRAKNPIEIPYLRVANVYADELRLDNIETIRVSSGERDRIGLLPGDLLIVEGNGSVDQIGRVAIWDGSIPNCGHQNHLIRVRPRDGIPSRFILHWLMSPYGRSVLETVASSSSGLHTLSLSKVSAIPIPIPPKVTAKNVITALDQAATRSAHAQREAVRALALLDRLEQSILARAFRAELVSHDPLDKPAQVSSVDVGPKLTNEESKTEGRIGQERTNAAKGKKGQGAPMLKSRHDTDVNSRPYLADCLRRLGQASTAEDLYRAADLPIADYYKQLSDEMKASFIRDVGGKLEAA